MRSRRSITDEELDGLSAVPQAGQVWWCEGAALRLPDGGKTRPVLVVGVRAGEAEVIPLTSRRSSGTGVPVRHGGGTSWLTEESPRLISVLSLLSILGTWAGFRTWQRR